MKRKIVSVISLLIVLGFTMVSTGCGGSGSSSDGTSPAGISGSAN